MEGTKFPTHAGTWLIFLAMFFLAWIITVSVGNRVPAVGSALRGF